MGSFQFHTEDEFTRAVCIEQLKPSRTSSGHHDKAGSETWRCAFTLDESCFAWSCGNRHVVIVPWNRATHSPSPVEDEHDAADKNRCNLSTDSRRRSVTIDCGYLVWSLAFGSGTPQSNLNHWMEVGSNFILATGLSNGRIRIWDVTTGKLLNELMDRRDLIRDLIFAPDGSLRLVSTSRDCTLKVWDLKDDGNMFKTLHTQNKWVYSCAWSPTAKLLACVGSGKMVFVWDMDHYILFRKLDGHSNDVVSCHFSPDGALLATASLDTRVLLWDPYTGEVLSSFGHLFPPPRPIFASGANDKWVRAVALSPDGSHMASVADDGYLRFWQLHDSSDPQEIALVENGICCTYSPSGSVLAVGNRSGCVSFWVSPVRVESLQHLSRLAIRRWVPTPDLADLEVPLRMKEYLAYKQ